MLPARSLEYWSRMESKSMRRYFCILISPVSMSQRVQASLSRLSMSSQTRSMVSMEDFSVMLMMKLV